MLTSVFPSELFVTQNKIQFSEFTPEDLSMGYKTANFTYISPLEINIDTQNSWSTYIQGDDFLMDDSGNKISIYHIEWKLSNGADNTYKPLHMEKQLITSSSTHSPNVELNFRIKVNWLTPPGSYSFPFEVILEESRNFSKKQKRLKKWPN